MSEWRKRFKVHPAADVFPMLSDEELEKLGEDIKQNGVMVPIMFWWPDDDARDAGVEKVLIDGRNRLEAAERLGFEIEDQNAVIGGDPVSHIISLNIHRRHLTPQQQLDLIVAAHMAVKPGHRVPVSKGGRSKKNPVKAAVMADAKAAGLDPSERTVKRSIARAEGRTPKPRKAAREAKAEPPTIEVEYSEMPEKRSRRTDPSRPFRAYFALEVVLDKLDMLRRVRESDLACALEDLDRLTPEQKNEAVEIVEGAVKIINAAVDKINGRRLGAGIAQPDAALLPLSYLAHAQSSRTRHVGHVADRSDDLPHPIPPSDLSRHLHAAADGDALD